MPADEGYTRRIILTDGTVLENCDCSNIDRGVWCTLRGISFEEAYQYFSDPRKFETIILELQYIDFIEKITYSGIDEVVSIVRSRDSIDIHLEGYRINETRERIRIPDPETTEKSGQYAEVEELINKGGE